MNHFTFSAPGHNHKNEDVVEVRPHPQDESVLLCALADGQGGQFGGGAAARVATEKTLQAASLRVAKELREAATWREITGAADDAVSQNQDAGYTTLIGFCVARDFLCGASCGDSALLLLNGAQLSWPTQQQRKNPPVGSGGAAPVAFREKLQSGWKLLAVSDGVYKYLGWDAIIAIAQRNGGDNLIAALHQLALKNNAGKLPDDFSIALLQDETL